MKRFLRKALLPLVLLILVLSFVVAGYSGFGPCKECSCKAFEGSYTHCESCGHLFESHS